MTLNLTREECAQRGSQLHVTAYRVELDLTAAPMLPELSFVSVTTIRFTSTEEATWLDLIAESVRSVQVNGQDHPIGDYDGSRIPLSGLRTGDAENVVEVKARCSYSRTGDGLHRFVDPEDGKVYLYTHFEPADARRMFACFDQPDLKAPVTFVVTAPGDWTVRSNSPEESREDHGGASTVTFAATPPLSTYIYGLAAGPYAEVTDSWSATLADGTQLSIPLALLSRRSMARYVEAEEIFEITKDGLDFYHASFGFPYPWGKYDQVFLPEYNIGAMENPGLVTFNEHYLFRGPATTNQRSSRSEVILHEMAHMWFGDLTTMRWWDDLWLKESFADLMGYQVSQRHTRFDRAWLLFALGRKGFAYRYDQLPTTHPVLADVPDLEAARNNFDGITYAKGAAVLRQLQAVIGDEAFFAASRDYFAEHAFANTTFADLLAVLEPRTDLDLAAWADVWLRTTTPSRLRPQVSFDDEGRITDLSVTQDCTDIATGEQVLRPHRLDVGLYAVSAGTLGKVAEHAVAFDGPSQPVPDATGQAADLVLVNDNDLTYGIIRLDERSRQTAAGYLSTLEDPLTRGLIWSSLWNQTRDAVDSIQDFTAVVIAQLPAETEPMLVEIVGDLTVTGLESFVPKQLRSRIADPVAHMAAEALQAAEPGSELQRSWAALVAQLGVASSAELDLVERLADGDGPEGLTIDPDLRWACTLALVSRGVWTEPQVHRQLDADPTMRGQTRYVAALSSRPEAAARQAVWDRLITDHQLTNDTQRALIEGFGRSRPGVEFAEPYAELLSSVWTDWPHSMAQRLVRLLPHPDLADGDVDSHPTLAVVRTWLTQNPDAAPALRRSVTEHLADAERALRAQALAGTRPTE